MSIWELTHIMEVFLLYGQYLIYDQWKNNEKNDLWNCVNFIKVEV